MTAPDAGLTGQLIAGYRVGACLSSGGMGQVYLAEQERLKRTVCIKTLLPGLASDATMVKRFEQEGLVLAGLKHPNLVTVLDVGQTPEGVLYLVMEYVRGRTLREVLIDEGPLSFTRAAGLVMPMLSGLHEAHTHDVIHRDLKPGNVMVGSLADGSPLVKVVDFGIARLTGQRRQGQPGLTRTGVLVGTIGYMAPEQLTDEPVTPASDVYSAGVILWELLTGTRLFTAPTEHETLRRQLTLVVPPPSEVSVRPVPPAFDEVVLTALEQDPTRRHRSALDFRNALQRALDASEALPEVAPRPPIAHAEPAVTAPASSPDLREEATNPGRALETDELAGLPFRRCAECEADSGAYDTACLSCGASLQTTAARALNRSLLAGFKHTQSLARAEEASRRLADIARVAEQKQQALRDVTPAPPTSPLASIALWSSGLGCLLAAAALHSPCPSTVLGLSGLGLVLKALLGSSTESWPDRRDR